jgi:hypothetical protein
MLLSLLSGGNYSAHPKGRRFNVLKYLHLSAVYALALKTLFLSLVSGDREQLFLLGPTEQIPSEGGERTQCPEACVFKIKDTIMYNVQ